ncbi:redoxin domain-containing protein [Paenibacillus sp. sgz302251]|uniref:redoxin domain-containing protein n=1 Tax=Paenibacillus sp. sgz302251 TaxID=3414493 RepID=UPI003C7AF925
MRKSMIGVLILIAIIGYGLYDSNRSSSHLKNVEPANAARTETGIQKGQRAPDFQLRNISGNAIKLSDYRGKTVLVNFWFSSCLACKLEMPYLEDIWLEYQDNDVVILAVNLTTTENREADLVSFSEKYELTFPIVMDLDGSVKQTYEVTAYPTTYFIDPRGIIQEIYPGVMNDDMIKQTIKRISR